MKNKNGKRMRMSPFTPTIPERIKKGVRAQRRKILTLNVSTVRRRVIINQIVGLKGEERRDRDHIRKERESRKPKTRRRKLVPVGQPKRRKRRNPRRLG